MIATAAIGCGGSTGAHADGAVFVDAPAAATDAVAAPDAPVTPDAAPAIDAGLPNCPAFADGVSLGTVESTDITEGSGVAASRANPGVLWTHNDSGDTPRLFAMTTSGKNLGVYNITGAQAVDWEDIAIGPGPISGQDYLYIGDIGDNNKTRAQIVVYRVPEPQVSTSQSPVTADVSGVVAIPLVYPDGPSNAETLMVDPATHDLFIVQKHPKTGMSPVLRAAPPYQDGVEQTLQPVTTLVFGQGQLSATSVAATAGDISPSGAQLIIRTYSDAFVWRRLPGATIADALATAPCRVPLASEPQGEAIAWAADESGYYTTSEGVNQPIFWFAHH